MAFMKPYLRQQVLSLIHLKDGNFKPCHLKYIFSMSCMRRLFTIILVPWISVRTKQIKMILHQRVQNLSV